MYQNFVYSVHCNDITLGYMNPMTASRPNTPGYVFSETYHQFAIPYPMLTIRQLLHLASRNSNPNDPNCANDLGGHHVLNLGLLEAITSRKHCPHNSIRES